MDTTQNKKKNKWICNLWTPNSKEATRSTLVDD
jgi:hypothetical protein